jgi:hypothetical protein
VGKLAVATFAFGREREQDNRHHTAVSRRSSATSSMRTSVLSFEDRLRQRLRRLASHARQHARTGQEADEIERLCQAVWEGHVSPRAALDALSSLRSEQAA